MNSIQAACLAVKEKLSSGDWHQGERLPSLAEMAALFCVSRTTMWRAIALLQKESLVHTRERGAIIAGPSGMTHFAKKSSRGLLWDRLRQRIGSEILTGSFSTIRLPLISKLARQYNVTVPTLRKALAGVVRDGLLIENGRGYRQQPHRSLTYQHSVILIADRESLPHDPRSLEVANSFERESLRQGFSCRLEGYAVRETDALIKFKQAFDQTRNLAGCIITLWNPWDATLKARWNDLFTFLSNRNVPLVIIDQSGDFTLSDPGPNHGTIRILRISGERAGEMAAGTLLRLGHRRIAFIASSLLPGWVRSRYTGLHRHVQRYGGPESGVELFAIGENPDHFYGVLDVLDIDKEDIRALFSRRFSKDEIVNLQKMADQIKEKRAASPLAADAGTKTIRYLAKAIIGLARQEHDPAVYELELERLLNIASDKSIELYIRPALTTVLEKSSATAWVFAEAKTALVGVSFLQAQGRKVPGQIAVLGFENWGHLVGEQLTSFDFNMNGMVQEALRMILDGKYLKSKPGISEVDGYVVERRTTRR